MLLFDEADAIFGKRSEVKDARDRHANIESAYLLQRMESFDGIAVLTTNLRANLDEAFTRRLDVVADFPVPDSGQRVALWERCLGDRLPRAEDLDLAFCADRFELAVTYTGVDRYEQTNLHSRFDGTLEIKANRSANTWTIQVSDMHGLGISESAIRTLASGGLPDDLSEPEKVAQRYAHRFSAEHRVDADLYRAAVSAFGQNGVVDLTYLIGIYHITCGLLNSFDIPAPDQAP